MSADDFSNNHFSLLSPDSSEEIGAGDWAVMALEDVEIEDSGESYVINPGGFVKVNSPDNIYGRAALMPGELFDEGLRYVPSDARNSGGFIFTNGSKAEIPKARYSEVELKSRFSDELRDYPETVHAHNVPEWYFAVGEFEMWLANDNFPNEQRELYEEAGEIGQEDPNAVVRENPDWFDVYEFSDSVLGVEEGQYHGIRDKDDSAYLGIVRGDPTGEEKWVGKWDLQGNQFYDHFDQEPNLGSLKSYGGD